MQFALLSHRMKVLVIEDEPKLNKGIVTGLQQRGYVVDAAFDGEEGERMAQLHAYDCLLLDVMLPKRDGFEVCRRLRESGVQTPILFLTARDGVDAKVFGLNLGADDYLVKPFSFDELVARIRSLLRRSPEIVGEVLTWNELRLDTRAQRVTVHNETVDLTVREYGVLEYLLRHRGAVVTRDEILSHVWDQFFDSLSNVVDVHVKNVRKKLPKFYAKRIETVWGKGYRLAA
jgi:two-component system, OmpR family, copper resistance phosphate regulon response regulator CusR